VSWLLWVWAYLTVGLLVSVFMSWLFSKDYARNKVSAISLWAVASKMGERLFWARFVAVFTVLYIPFFIVLLILMARARFRRDCGSEK
jgi:membrane glycosyltransferase